MSRILIVEDEPNIVESLSFILERAGFEVQTATDGEQALRYLSHGIYDAMILDIMLPGMNGFDLLRRIRADARLSRLPVIVLTARGQEKDRRMAESAGASSFITKPFSNEELVRQVERLAGA